MADSEPDSCCPTCVAASFPLCTRPNTVRSPRRHLPEEIGPERTGLGTHRSLNQPQRFGAAKSGGIVRFVMSAAKPFTIAASKLAVLCRAVDFNIPDALTLHNSNDVVCLSYLSNPGEYLRYCEFVHSWSNATASVRCNNYVVIVIECGTCGSLNSEVCRDTTYHHRLASSATELQIKFSPEERAQPLRLLGMHARGTR